MTFDEWKTLAEDEQDRRAQSLNPYDDWPVFEAIGKSFRESAASDAVLDVFCGFASGLGPLNAITVTLKKGSRVPLPKTYLGLPVIKRYQ